MFFCSCCLAGRAYPLGDIPEDLVVQVKHQVCKCSCTSVKVLTITALFFEFMRSNVAFQTVHIGQCRPNKCRYGIAVSWAKIHAVLHV